MAKTRLSKKLLSSSADAHQLDAAWDLLHAVEALHPELIRELRNLGPDNEERVRQWTQRHKISCPTVVQAAQQMASGLEHPPEAATEVVIVDDELMPVDPPGAIQADAFNETLDEFTARARDHWTQTYEWYEKHGNPQRPVKRDSDHFRYLVAHLIDGCSWSDIAEGRTRFDLPRRSQATVGGEAREAARLIGLRLVGRRGRRRRKRN